MSRRITCAFSHLRKNSRDMRSPYVTELFKVLNKVSNEVVVEIRAHEVGTTC